MTLDDVKGLLARAAGNAPDEGAAEALTDTLSGMIESIGTLARKLAEDEALRQRGPDATDGADAPLRLETLFGSATIASRDRDQIDRVYLPQLRAGRSRYQAVGKAVACPWWVVGLVHGLEAGFDFSRHLHNGDPLSARTVRHPAGRPSRGAPPFGWEESAIDALRGAGLTGLDGEGIGGVLDALERYNGLGYRRRGIASPYLWSFTSHYARGKYVADGRFDPDAVSAQPGAAALMLRLFADTAQTVLPVFAREKFAEEASDPGLLSHGAQGPAVVRLQEWLNLSGQPIVIDGAFGPKTAAALQAFGGAESLDPAAWQRLTAPMRSAHAPLPGSGGIHAMTLAAAERHLAAQARELSHGGQGNRGPWVRLYMLGQEGDAWPWCAGFVSHVVGQAAAALGRAMPLRRQVGVDALVANARAERRFLPEARLATPAARQALVRPGTIFCIRRTASDWTHTGIVRSVTNDFFTTIEGNSNDRGSREGVAVVSNRRGWEGVDFVTLT